jgi:hypothetical protein
MSDVTRYCYRYDGEHEEHTSMIRIHNDFACVVLATDYDAMEARAEQAEARVAALEARLEVDRGCDHLWNAHQHAEFPCVSIAVCVKCGKRGGT